MNQTLLANEPFIRLGFFLGVFALMAAWEFVAPRRRPGLSRWLRWPNNLGITAVNTALVRLIFPTAAVAVALLGQQRGWGLLNNVDFAPWVKVAIAVIALDFVIYLQHVLFHAVPALWRLHRMHHADLDFDVTTGARFHPVEILLSMVIKFATVAALGAPAVAVLIFEVLLNATSMFNHGNVRVSQAIERVLRCLVVTPDMHRVHHSVVRRETDSNFGFNFSWWDRLFGTYRAQPEAGHEAMTIGIAQFRTSREQWLDRMLTQPLRDDAGGYPLGRREREMAA